VLAEQNRYFLIFDVSIRLIQTLKKCLGLTALAAF
jgi:hypothetical protein